MKIVACFGLLLKFNGNTVPEPLTDMVDVVGFSFTCLYERFFPVVAYDDRRFNKHSLASKRIYDNYFPFSQVCFRVAACQWLRRSASSLSRARAPVLLKWRRCCETPSNQTRTKEREMPLCKWIFHVKGISRAQSTHCRYFNAMTRWPFGAKKKRERTKKLHCENVIIFYVCRVCVCVWAASECVIHIFICNS